MPVCRTCLKDENETRFSKDQRYDRWNNMCNKCLYKQKQDPTRPVIHRSGNKALKKALFLIYWHRNKHKIIWG